MRLPTGFLPDEDQGSSSTLITLPAGATQTAPLAVGATGRALFPRSTKKHNVDFVFTVAGFNFAGTGQNLGMAFIHLKRLEGAPGQRRTAPTAIAHRAMRALLQRSATRQVFTLVPPAVQELGNATGFDLELEDRGGLGHDAPDRGAQPAAGHGGAGPAAGAACAPTAWTTRRSCTSTSTRPRPTRWACRMADINTTFSAAWGGDLHQQFRRPRPGQAGLHAGRCAVTA